MSLLSSSTRSWYAGQFGCKVLDRKGHFYPLLYLLEQNKGQRIFSVWNFVSGPCSLWSWSCPTALYNYRSCFTFLKDLLMTWQTDIVLWWRNFCPLSHELLCHERGIWSQETILSPVPGKLWDGDLWAGGLSGNVLEISTCEGWGKQDWAKGDAELWYRDNSPSYRDLWS